ncbi:hypothetical protein GW965_05205 [Clostridium perfringens]|nr:hypothetical protein [Clostridium perfringens]
MFRIKGLYSRNDIYDILKVPENKRGGIWNTGYVKYNGEYYVFSNLSKEGADWHSYDNHWEKGLLCLSGKPNSHRNQKSIKELVDRKTKVHIFTRMNNYEKFTYEGVGKAVKIKDTVPVKIYWKFKNNSGISDLNIKEEVTYMKFPKDLYKSNNKMYYSPKDISDKIKGFIKFFKKFFD